MMRSVRRFGRSLALHGAAGAVIAVTCNAVLAVEATTQPTTAPTAATVDRPIDVLKPLPTPAEALERAMQSYNFADEEAYHQGVLLISPHRYVEAASKFTFAGFRLHKAVSEMKVKRERVLPGQGWDPSQSLPDTIVHPPDSRDWETLRDTVRGFTWQKRGNLASPVDAGPFLDLGAMGRMQVMYMEGGWVVAIADPVTQARPEQLKAGADKLFIYADTVEETTRRVLAGELKTMREVNDFLQAERERRSK